MWIIWTTHYDEAEEDDYDEDFENRVDALETNNNLILHTLDEAFSSLITIKTQMRLIFPYWCYDCGVDFEDEGDIKIHRKKKRFRPKIKANNWKFYFIYLYCILIFLEKCNHFQY